MNNQRGFVLIEFVLALPLILMLLYGLAETTLQIYRLAKVQAADYVLAYEAQESLTRITDDLRAASRVTIDKAKTGNEYDSIIIEYHGASTFYYENDKKRFDDRKIFDVIDTRVYKVGKINHKLQAKRQDDDAELNPITGGNFFGDTSVTKLKFSKLDDDYQNVVHITLEMASIVTNEKIKLSTAVFMPAYEDK